MTRTEHGRRASLKCRTGIRRDENPSSARSACACQRHAARYVVLHRVWSRENHREEAVGPQTDQSFEWARATGPDRASAEAWLQTGDSCGFAAAASVRAVEETFTQRRRGAISRGP
jgi:hypothetical protein